MSYINRNKITKRKALGVLFPIQEASSPGVFRMSSTTLERVKSSLYVLLFTQRGSRVMNPEFGSPIFDHMFEGVDDVAIEEIRSKLISAISKWVPEVKITSIELQQPTTSPNSLVINLKYTLVQNPMLEDSITVTAR